MTAARPYKGAIVIVPPCVIGAWAMQLIHEAAAECQPPLQVRLLDLQDDVDLQAAPSCIFLTQYSSASVANVIAAGSLPVVAVVDDAVNAVAYLMRTTGCGFVEALRLTTCAAAINPQLADGISVRVIHRRASVGAARTVNDIVDHLALPVSATGLPALRQRFALAYPHLENLEESCSRRVEGYAATGDPPPELTEDQRGTVETVLTPLIAMSAGERDTTITWPSEVFLSGDQPNQVAPIVADMTGAARIIYYGPYLYLPKGEWQVEITVGFSKEAVGSHFTVEVYGAEMLARARFEARHTGIFSGSFQFSHPICQDHLEMRFSSDRGSIEGHFGLAWVKFFATERTFDHSVE